MTTGINWTDETWNPTVGCSRVSPGCANCYAEHAAAMVNRTQGVKSVYSDLLRVIDGDPRWNGNVRLIAERLAIPLGWRKPRRIFVNSMSDLFHERLTNEEIAAVFGVMAACPQHTFQVLTKRPARMREWFDWVAQQTSINGDGIIHVLVDHAVFSAPPVNDEGDFHPGFAEAHGRPWPLPNVWLGVSVENQDAADERIPDLLETPAAVRFISAEPLLDDTSIWAYLKGALRDESLAKLGGDPNLPGLDWVIAGCESGDGARSCEVDWLRSLAHECARAGVPFWLKQAMAVGSAVSVGCDAKRKRGGVIDLPYLDGRQWAQMPEARP